MKIIGYLILGLMVIIVPMTVTILYARILYKYNKNVIHPLKLFFILLGIEIVYLIYLYLFKFK